MTVYEFSGIIETLCSSEGIIYDDRVVERWENDDFVEIPAGQYVVFRDGDTPPAEWYVDVPSVPDYLVAVVLDDKDPDWRWVEEPA